MTRKHYLLLLAVFGLLAALTIPFSIQPASAHPSYGKPCCHGAQNTPTPTPKPTQTPTPKPTQTPAPQPTQTPGPVPSATATPAPVGTPDPSNPSPAPQDPAPVANPAAPSEPAAPAASASPAPQQAFSELARAAERVAPSGDNLPNHSYFNETGHFVANGFLAYWKRHGGVDVFGYPITEELTENGHVVQYFQRARFEYHAEFKGTAYETELGLLGRDLTAGKGGAAFVPPYGQYAPASTANVLFFAPESGFPLANGFKAYWQSHGGLAVFGLPISNEFMEVNPADGQSYTVQYFERARFEYHPEFKGTAHEVELGLLGSQAIFGK